MSEPSIAEEDRAAGVTPRAPWRVAAIRVLAEHRLAVEFNDGLRGEADLSALVRGPDAGLFAALADPSMFAGARIELGVITWPNGADLDPCWLYDSICATGRWPG